MYICICMYVYIYIYIYIYSHSAHRGPGGEVTQGPKPSAVQLRRRTMGGLPAQRVVLFLFRGLQSQNGPPRWAGTVSTKYRRTFFQCPLQQSGTLSGVGSQPALPCSSRNPSGSMAHLKHE